MRYVIAYIKDNELDIWAWVGGFSISSDSDPESVARRARGIVDHKGVETVEIQVYNPETKLYDLVFTFPPVKF